VKLNEIDLIKLLPAFMRACETNEALAGAISKLFQKLDNGLSKLSIWDKISDLTEAELDELAWEFNVLWYDAGASVEVKRRLIKNAKKVWSSLGTVFAVECVVDDYFPKATVQRWFEYGGKPHYFRICSNNPEILTMDTDEFLRRLEKVKKKSSWLDGITLQLEGLGHVNFGVAICDYTKDTYIFD